MFLRILVICLWILALLPSAPAQVSRRKAQKPRTTKSSINSPDFAPANEGKTGAITLRQSELRGWVWVSHTIDLAQQLGGEENIMTLDGEPLPSMQKRRVTLGLVIDDEGHVVTRLVDVAPSNPPINVAVRALDSKPTTAKFLGMDTVTGLCVLKTEGISLKTPVFSDPATLRARYNIRLYGFHPNLNQGVSAAMSLESPRRNIYPGQIAKAVNDFRYHAGNPIYYLLSPQLTPVQDCSLILEKDNSVFGIAIYSIGGEGKHLVYPVSRVQTIAQSVIKSHKSIAYGWLGATGRDVYAPIPTKMNAASAPAELGVRITAVAPDSPAELAGVKPLDVVVSVNDRKVDTHAQMVTLMRQIPPDSEVTLRVRRGAEYRVLKAKLVPAPATEPEQQLIAFASQLEGIENELKSLPATDPSRPNLEGRQKAWLGFIEGIRTAAPLDIRLRVYYGFEVQPLTVQLMNYFTVTNGVLVTNVKEDDKAAKSGLQAGDVIVKVGEKTVTNLAILIAALDAATGESVEITVSRRREQVKIAFQR
jgi:S1-C subfamily serine protease